MACLGVERRGAKRTGVEEEDPVGVMGPLPQAMEPPRPGMALPQLAMVPPRVVMAPPTDPRVAITPLKVAEALEAVVADEFAREVIFA